MDAAVATDAARLAGVPPASGSRAPARDERAAIRKIQWRLVEHLVMASKSGFPDEDDGVRLVPQSLVLSEK